MQKQAKITSKGQITVPREVRRILGVRAGTGWCLKAMQKVSMSGQCAIKAHSLSTAGLAIRGSRLAEKALVDGSESSADNDNGH